MPAPRLHLVLDDVIPADLCDLVIKTFDEDKSGQKSGDLTVDGVRKVNRSVKVSTDIDIGDRLITERGKELWGEIDKRLFEVVSSSWSRYRSEVKPLRHVDQSGIVDTGYRIQRYEKGEGKFIPHADASSYASGLRFAAAVLYFNDVEEGGETYFPYWDEWIQAIKGRVLWFPAGFTHVHEGRVPISGPKYVASTFMQFSS